MNEYIKNLNRIEFVITNICTGHCKHCSEAEKRTSNQHLNSDMAADVVTKVASKYQISSVMTFGGEPLLHPDVVCSIHAAAQKSKIPKRQIITNGFFTKNEEEINQIANQLAQNGVNDILLSVDAFHQETIPVYIVKQFAKAIQKTKISIRIRTHPAWLISPDAKNDYNQKTSELLEEFMSIGIQHSKGNVIFPSGNAIKYLSEYFDENTPYVNPYKENPKDIHAICIFPDGAVLNGNLNQADILDILDHYTPNQK